MRRIFILIICAVLILLGNSASAKTLVVYDSNSYSYTRLGKISGLTANELKTFLKGGQSNIRVTLSLPGTTAVNTYSVSPSPEGEEAYYSLNGQKVTAPRKGIYIVRSGNGRLQGKNGKKRVFE